MMEEQKKEGLVMVGNVVSLEEAGTCRSRRAQGQEAMGSGGNEDVGSACRLE